MSEKPVTGSEKLLWLWMKRLGMKKYTFLIREKRTDRLFSVERIWILH